MFKKKERDSEIWELMKQVAMLRGENIALIGKVEYLRERGDRYSAVSDATTIELRTLQNLFVSIVKSAGENDYMKKLIEMKFEKK